LVASVVPVRSVSSAALDEHSGERDEGRNDGQGAAARGMDDKSKLGRVCWSSSARSPSCWS
jgi:hypothetical protein